MTFSFEETSWRKYSERQRTLRDRALLLLRTRTNIAQFAPPGMPFLPMGPSPIKSENFNRSNPPPVISSNGTVAVTHSMGDRRGPPGKKALLMWLLEISSRECTQFSSESTAKLNLRISFLTQNKCFCSRYKIRQRRTAASFNASSVRHATGYATATWNAWHAGHAAWDAPFRLSPSTRDAGYASGHASWFSTGIQTR